MEEAGFRKLRNLDGGLTGRAEFGFVGASCLAKLSLLKVESSTGLILGMISGIDSPL